MVEDADSQARWAVIGEAVKISSLTMWKPRRGSGCECRPGYTGRRGLQGH